MIELKSSETQASAGNGTGMTVGAIRTPRRRGKQQGWFYIRTAKDARAALVRVLNLMLIGDTKEQRPEGTPPPKIDPRLATAAATVIRAWLECKGEEIEAKLDEMLRTNQEIMKLLDDRRNEGGGGKPH